MSTTHILKQIKSKAMPRRNSLVCRFSLQLIELRLLCSLQNHFTTTSRWGVLINIQAGCVWSWKTKGYGAFTISILQCLFVLCHLAKMKMQSYSTQAPVSQTSSEGTIWKSNKHKVQCCSSISVLSEAVKGNRAITLLPAYFNINWGILYTLQWSLEQRLWVFYDYLSPNFTVK